MLSDYGIENVATKIADKEHDIFEIETPFIAHFGGNFVPVYQVDSDKVRYIWRGKMQQKCVLFFYYQIFKLFLYYETVKEN
jgi:hypothetical protein